MKVSRLLPGVSSVLSVYAAPFLAALLFVGCSRSSSPGPALAQVDDDPGAASNEVQQLSESLLGTTGDVLTPALLAFRLELADQGLPKEHRVRLRREQNVFSDTFRTFDWDGSLRERTRPSRDCLYVGYIEQQGADGSFVAVEDSFAALNGCGEASPDGSPLMSGLLAIDGEVWDLRLNKDAIEGDQPAADAISRTSPSYRLTPLRVGHTRELAAPGEVRLTQLAPEVLSAPLEQLMPFREGTDAETKFIELLVFNDAPLVAAAGDDAAIDDALVHLGTLNALFRISELRPRVRVSIAGVINITADPFTVQPDGNGEVNPEQLLREFVAWSIMPNLPAHDVRLFFVGRDFESSVAGIAPVGAACQSSSSVVLVESGSGGEPIIAAHELGHSIGMGHDSVDNNCADSSNLMAARACRDCLTFSQCSIDEFAEYLGGPSYRAGQQCLDNVPAAPIATQCGDGIVGGNEECDCGEADCAELDPCCNGETCQLNPGSQCSDFNDDCCAGCQVVPAAEQQVCRAAQSSCDAEEVCNGRSKACPSDVFSESPGTVCEDDRGNDGQCYQGRCVSLSATCEDLGERLGVQLTGPVANCPLSCAILSCSQNGRCIGIEDAIPNEGSPCGQGGLCVRGECQQSVDECPANPSKTEPGVCGCNVSDDDSDGDGTPDCTDGCPLDADKQSPGACGCGQAESTRDSDGDGAADCIDACPDDAAKAESAGQCGCGVVEDAQDNDQDGTFNCVDSCPLDPEKVQPGDCGCDLSEADGDSDGIPDCIDACPTDPNKTDPGQCGCGEEEVVGDADEDGVPDCSDACPTDPDKSEAGDCGCGQSESDTDNDGTADCIDGCPEDGLRIASPCGAINVLPELQDDGGAAPPSLRAEARGGCSVATRPSVNPGAVAWSVLGLFLVLPWRRRRRIAQRC